MGCFFFFFGIAPAKAPKIGTCGKGVLAKMVWLWSSSPEAEASTGSPMRFELSFGQTLTLGERKWTMERCFLPVKQSVRLIEWAGALGPGLSLLLSFAVSLNAFFEASATWGSTEGSMATQERRAIKSHGIFRMCDWWILFLKIQRKSQEGW